MIESIKKKNFSKELVFTYKISAGIPFKWKYEIKDRDIVYLDKSYVIKNRKNKIICGGPVYTNYIFKGKKEGSTLIIFKYISLNDNSIVSEDRYNVYVDRDKKIFIE